MAAGHHGAAQRGFAHLRAPAVGVGDEELLVAREAVHHRRRLALQLSVVGVQRGGQAAQVRNVLGQRLLAVLAGANAERGVCYAPSLAHMHSANKMIIGAAIAGVMAGNSVALDVEFNPETVYFLSRVAGDNFEQEEVFYPDAAGGTVLLN